MYLQQACTATAAHTLALDYFENRAVQHASVRCILTFRDPGCWQSEVLVAKQRFTV